MRTSLLIGLFLVLAGCASKASFDDNYSVTDAGFAPQLESQPTSLRLIIIGGTAGIGLELVKLALERGHQVTAVARRPERMSLSHDNLALMRGDITSLEDMRALIPNHDIVISTIGLAAGSRNVTVFSQGISNLLAVMSETGQNRLLAISAIGAGDSIGKGGFWFDNLLQPLILGDDIADKTRMEKILQNQSINYTVIRPAILTNAKGQRSYRVFTQLEGVETGTIAREDVAHFFMYLAETNAYQRELVTLSD